MDDLICILLQQITNDDCDTELHKFFQTITTTKVQTQIVSESKCVL